MRARVVVTLKSGILDPQGKAIEGALAGLGIEGVASVRQGKIFDVTLSDQDQETARSTLDLACRRLLANTVVENYRLEIEPDGAGVPPAASPPAEDPFAPDAAVLDSDPATRAAESAAEHAEMPPEGHP